MTERGKQPGNIGELMTMGMCVLALTVVMLNYLQNVQLLQAKENVGQLARAYLLKMETVGYLEPAEQAHLTAELETAGLTEIDYEGSTLEPAGYGERIILQIHGKLGGHYEIREKRVSTAKTENRQETEKAESGQVSWVLGLFLILFLAILLYMQLQLAMYKASARYLEDALALSNLASAVIDIREYGSTHKVHITDQEQAYAGYCSAVRENLGLNENYEAVSHKLISGKVEIRNYIIYNVTGTKVQVWERNGDGRILEWEGTLGEVRTPGGQTIENTGVYSEITYPVEGFLGITVTAEKSKLVDVVSEYMGEETNEKRKMSQAWKNRIWNGSILAAFVAAMAVFVFCCRQKRECLRNTKKNRYAW